MHAFWSVLIYDLLEDRRIDEVIIKTFFKYIYKKLLLELLGQQRCTVPGGSRKIRSPNLTANMNIES